MPRSVKHPSAWGPLTRSPNATIKNHHIPEALREQWESSMLLANRVEQIANMTRQNNRRRAAWPMQAPGEISGELTVQRQGVMTSQDSLSTEAEYLADDRTGHEEA